MQDCTLRNRFVSIDPTFLFFPRSLFLFFTRTRTLEYARNTLPPLIRETSILLLGPRRYCRIAAMLPIRSSHYSPTRIGIGKDEPIHPFFPASMRFERDVGCCGCGLFNEIRNFGNFFFAIRWSFLYYNFLDLFEMVSVVRRNVGDDSVPMWCVNVFALGSIDTRLWKFFPLCFYQKYQLIYSLEIVEGWWYTIQRGFENFSSTNYYFHECHASRFFPYFFLRLFSI